MGNTLRKEKHKLVNVFSNFNVSKETSYRKIGDQPNRPNNSIKIKTATVSEVSQKAIGSLSVQKYRLRNKKKKQ